MELHNQKIVLTGGAGFLGRSVYRKLIEHGAKKENILVPRSSTHDLRDRKICEEVVEGKDIVIHLIEEKCANIDFKINVSKVK